MDLIRALHREAKKAGSQKALANRMGVDPTYLSRVMREQKEAGPAILDPLGLERVVVYRRKRQPQ